tara:strand:- start:650 stop:1666 length:1017 start_codon:yes stop_codon:yes gene_type:complete
VAIESVVLCSKKPPWQSTSLRLNKGQAYSLFADGVIRWSQRHPHLFGGPAFHLWARVSPGGRAMNLCSNSSETFVADVPGELELGIYMGVWENEFGDLKTSDDLYKSLVGVINTTVVIYRGGALEALEKISTDNTTPTVIAGEVARLRSPTHPPSGWHYLHEIGYSDIYREEATATGVMIHAKADDAQGILRHPVDFPVTRTTALQWQWKVDEHPSRDPENHAISHDYISLAAEFDNGHDLTWIWSSCLTPGSFFNCPIRGWHDREAHYVIRSQQDRLGRWYSENRNIYDDALEAMGSSPTKITAIWLIVLSTFHHRSAYASFTKIKLVNDEAELAVA